MKRRRGEACRRVCEGLDLDALMGAETGAAAEWYAAWLVMERVAGLYRDGEKRPVTVQRVVALVDAIRVTLEMAKGQTDAETGRILRDVLGCSLGITA